MWATSHTPTSYVKISMSHVTHINKSWHTHQWVMSRWPLDMRRKGPVSHVTHTNESCHTSNESCHTYQQVVSHTSMGHVTLAFGHSSKRACGSRHTYQRVMSHVTMSRITHINESCHFSFSKSSTRYYEPRPPIQ